MALFLTVGEVGLISTACTLAGVIVTQRFAANGIKANLEHQRRVAADDRLFEQRIESYRLALGLISRLERMANPFLLIPYENENGEILYPALDATLQSSKENWLEIFINVSAELSSFKTPIEIFGSERVYQEFNWMRAALAQCVAIMLTAAVKSEMRIDTYELTTEQWLSLKQELTEIGRAKDAFINAVRKEMHGI